VDWSQLNARLTELLPRELTVLGGLVSIGVGIILVVALRSWRGALLTLLTLFTTFCALLGAMAWLGLTWNLFNLATVLLLCGMGVDYAIHFLHAQAYGRPTDPVRGVLILCGLSTTTGFASISTASNLGLASLGATCALGIFFLTLFSVFILPVASGSLQSSVSVVARDSAEGRPRARMLGDKRKA
jgi:predicted RND superfamily exporter protein